MQKHLSGISGKEDSFATYTQIFRIFSPRYFAFHFIFLPEFPPGISRILYTNETFKLRKKECWLPLMLFHTWNGSFHEVLEDRWNLMALDSRATSKSWLTIKSCVEMNSPMEGQTFYRDLSLANELTNKLHFAIIMFRFFNRFPEKNKRKHKKKYSTYF